MPETMTPPKSPTGDAAAGAPRPRRGAGTVALARLRDLALVPAIVLIAIVGQLINPVFLKPDNLINIAQTMSEIALLVLAQTIVLVAGKMALSLESTSGLAPGVAAWMTVAVGAGHGRGLVPGSWAIPITLAVGALIGVANAAL